MLFSESCRNFPDNGTLKYRETGCSQIITTIKIIDGPYESWVDANRMKNRIKKEKPVGDFQL
jgi:hypothetical protein